MDHSVKAMPVGRRRRIMASASKVIFRRHKFENQELEKLFQVRARATKSGG